MKKAENVTQSLMMQAEVMTWPLGMIEEGYLENYFAYYSLSNGGNEERLKYFSYLQCMRKLLNLSEEQIRRLERAIDKPHEQLPYFFRFNDDLILRYLGPH